MKSLQQKKQKVYRYEYISEERKQMLIPKLPHPESGKKKDVGQQITSLSKKNYCEHIMDRNGLYCKLL